MKMKTAIACCGCVFFLVGLVTAHLCLGARLIAPEIVWSALHDYSPKNYLHVIVVMQRLPRLVVALWVGAMLALSGYVLQKILRNDLVSPSTLGINSGATTFCVAALYFWGTPDTNLFWPALTGGICALLFSFAAANILGRNNQDQISLILGGAMSSTLFATASAFIISLDTDLFGDLLGWLVGDIGIFDLQPLLAIWPAGLGAILGLLIVMRPLDLMGLGKGQAAALGVNTQWLQIVGLGGAIILSIVAVSVVGPIGFVGLVVPHMVKILFGETGMRPPILCLIFGGGLVAAADIAARMIVAPQLLNVGSIMALSGGLAFLFMIAIVFGKRPA